jgi:hypothetical protein
MFEAKNKKTGKLYFLDEDGIADLRKLGILNRYIIQELKPLGQIKSPLVNYDIKKSSKTDEGKRK